MVNWSWIITAGVVCGVGGTAFGFFVSMHFIGVVTKRILEAKETK